MMETEPYIIMDPKTMKETSEHISRCTQLAILLEVSAYPKPGNVHRIADFEGTRYEHFLASAVALAPHFSHAAKQGVLVKKEKIGLNQIEVGKIIKEAVMDVAFWQHGGNTVLGSIILLAPIAVAAGMTLAESEFSTHKLRKNLKSVAQSTTSKDAVNLYEAIETAHPGGLGKAPRLDVTQAASKKKLIQDNVSLYQIFQISAPWDSISSEWVNNYQITFDLGYPFFSQQLAETRDINMATVHTFLKILSAVPDTLISRKAGTAKAREISKQAKKALEEGGLANSKSKEKLFKFDAQLRSSKHRLSPGTTADITSAVLALAILNGYRP